MKGNLVQSSNKTLSAIGLGCSRIGSFNSPLSRSDIRSLLAAAFDSGVSVFDTADVYGQGDSERELGRFLAGHRREAAFVITKGGKLFSRKMRLLRPFKPLLKPLLAQGGRKTISDRRTDEISEDFSSAHIVRAVEGSLRRLRADKLDGFLLHSPPASVVSNPSIWETIVRLRDSGKIASFGVSCDTEDVLEASLRVPELTLLELPYNVLVAMDNSDNGREIARRQIVVLAREVIRCQPGIEPDKAIQNAASMRLVSTVIIGTSKIQNLQSAISAVTT
jgi:aryl-alcohol dehydrogenase-like predicted oxidoreductase